MNAATAVSTTTVVRQGPSPIQEIPLATIRESRTNPCRHFDEAKLAELADNIKQYGVLQPILLRPAPSGSSDRYELVAGERRAASVPLWLNERGDRAQCTQGLRGGKACIC